MAIQVGALVDVVSGSFGIEVITIDNDIGVGADQECREVIIWQEAGKSVQIGESVAKAAAGPVLIPDTEQYLRLPIINTNLLHFKGTDGDDVYLLWRI